MFTPTFLPTAAFPILAALLLLLAGCPQPDPPLDDAELPDAERTHSDPVERPEQRGLALVASGVDPEWRLAIEHGGSLTLTPVFGMDALASPAPIPVHDEARGVTTYQLDADALTMLVEVHDRECQDPRGAELFEVTVHVEMNGRELMGCGSWLLEEGPGTEPRPGEGVGPGAEDSPDTGPGPGDEGARDEGVPVRTARH